MTLVLLLVALAVVGAIAVVAGGGWGAPAESEPERSPRGALPPSDSVDDHDELDAAALGGLRFTVGLRGYRMDEVDAVLDRVGNELDRRAARIAELESAGAEPEPEPAPAGPESRLDG